MIRMSVDFPAPFSPSRAWTSPARTSKLTPFSAGNPAKDLAMPCSSTMLVTRRPPCQIGPPAVRGKAVTTDDALQCRRGTGPPRDPVRHRLTPATRCDPRRLSGRGHVVRSHRRVRADERGGREGLRGDVEAPGRRSRPATANRRALPRRRRNTARLGATRRSEMRKVGIYYAFWTHEWEADFLPFVPKVK